MPGPQKDRGKARPGEEVTDTSSACGRAYLTVAEASRRLWGSARRMAPLLGPHELLHVFSFLEAPDLLRAAKVNKVRSGGVTPPPGSAGPAPQAQLRRPDSAGLGPPEYPLHGLALPWLPCLELTLCLLDRAPALLVICPALHAWLCASSYGLSTKATKSLLM